MTKNSYNQRHNSNLPNFISYKSYENSFKLAGLISSSNAEKEKICLKSYNLVRIVQKDTFLFQIFIIFLKIKGYTLM